MIDGETKEKQDLESGRICQNIVDLQEGLSWRFERIMSSIVLFSCFNDSGSHMLRWPCPEIVEFSYLVSIRHYKTMGAMNSLHSSSSSPLFWCQNFLAGSWVFALTFQPQVGMSALFPQVSVRTISRVEVASTSTRNQRGSLNECPIFAGMVWQDLAGSKNLHHGTPAFFQSNSLVLTVQP